MDPIEIKCPHCFSNITYLNWKFSQKPSKKRCPCCDGEYTIKLPWPIIKKVKAKSDHKLLRDECDDLYLELIKAMAGYKCEITKQSSGEPGIILQTHHILHKSNHYMRYLIENGICIDKRWHAKDNLATPGAKAHLEEEIKRVRGEDIYKILSDKHRASIHYKTQVDLKMTKIMLQQELRKYGA